MMRNTSTELLKLLWMTRRPLDCLSVDGQLISVRKNGEWDPVSELFRGAQIICAGEIYHGDILVGEAGTDRFDAGNVILHVVSVRSGLLMKRDGTAVPQLAVEPGALMRAAYETLAQGSSKAACAVHLAAMEEVERITLFTRLLIDRLHRKSSDARFYYEQNDSNWNEAMYIILFRTMGGMINKEPFTELARRVSYSRVSRERGDIRCVEALLLGASGLLDLYDEDSYVRELKSDFEYLRRKYDVTAMMPSQWRISRNNPHNHPVLRIAQLAAFLTTREFVFDNIINCTKVEQLQLLFRAEASGYWSSHYIPGRKSAELPKRIGSAKANLLGINLAAPLMFAYGEHSADEDMKMRAIELLEKINCESNSVLDSWRKGGVKMESAFDSQAIMQLNNELCSQVKCWNCPLAKRVLKKIDDSSFYIV